MKKEKEEDKYNIYNYNDWHNHHCDTTWLSKMKL